MNVIFVVSSTAPPSVGQNICLRLNGVISRFVNLFKERNLAKKAKLVAPKNLGVVILIDYILKRARNRLGTISRFCVHVVLFVTQFFSLAIKRGVTKHENDRLRQNLSTA